MKAKNIISMILIATAAVSLVAGCGSNAENSQTDSTKQTAQKDTEATKETPEANDSAETEVLTTGSGNTLVVYYSATGNTQAVANAIAEATNADVFELEPEQTYSDADLDWTDENSRVSREHENENEREIALTAKTVDNWGSIDTVLIGYPLWWGSAAWPVDGFIEANDFTGKTVIPFATSSTSDMGESGKMLAEMAGTGDWQEGKRFRSGASQQEVQDWVEELGLSQ